MATAYCEPCKSRGSFIQAATVVDEDGKRVPKCEPCAGQGKSSSPRFPSDIPGRRVEIDWAAVQRERDNDVPVRELAKKLGCSEAYIYQNTRTPQKTAPVTPAPNPDRRSTAFQQAMQELLKERERIDRAIEALLPFVE
jgi:hypothetical protein